MTSLPSPSPTNKSPVCSPVTMETPPASLQGTRPSSWLSWSLAPDPERDGLSLFCPLALGQGPQTTLPLPPPPVTLAGLLLFRPQIRETRGVPDAGLCLQMGVQEGSPGQLIARHGPQAHVLETRACRCAS